MNRDWSEIYNQPNYPESFEYKGFMYNLEKEGLLYRRFRRSDGLRVGTSRFQDASIDVTPEWIFEYYLELHESDRKFLGDSLEWMEISRREGIEKAIAEVTAR